jgi:hypothetical protein
MLTRFDFLGPEVKLSVTSKENFKTGAGALASLFMLIVTIAAFMGFGSDIFKREKPKVTFNRVVDEGTPIYNITDNNFLFALYDQYSDEPIPDFDRRYTPYFQYFDVVGSQSDIIVKFFEKCSQETLDHWKGNFAMIGPSNYLCFPKNSTWPLKGVMLQGSYNMIRIQLSYCQNNTDPNLGRVVTNCIPKQETVKFLAGKRIQIHYIIETTLVDTMNYETPQTKTAYTGYGNTDALSWSRMTILYKTLVTDTDEGFFTVSKKTTSFSAVESIQPEAIYSPETTAVFSHLVGNSRYKETYTRVYIKIQDIFAMMGGFINGALLILKFIVAYLRRPDLINLFNNISKYQPIESKKQPTKINFGESFIGKEPRSFNNNEQLNSPNVNFHKRTMSPVSPQKKVIDTLESPFNPIKSPSRRDQKIIIEEIELLNEQLKNANKEEKSNHASEIRKMDSNSLNCKSVFLIQRKYLFKFNSCTRTFKCCFTKKIQNQVDILNQIEKKMIKTISFENLTNITRYSKLFKVILLEKYQDEIFKMCNYPKETKEKLKISALRTLSEKLSSNNRGETIADKLDLKLSEYLKK